MFGFGVYRFLLAVIFVLILSITGFSQSRDNFESLKDGFSIAKAVEVNGNHSLLVLFPPEYLGSTEKIDAGIEKVMPIIFGCDFWPSDCKAKITGRKLDQEQKISYVYFDILIDKEPIRVFVYGLADKAKDGSFVGVVIMLDEIKEN